RLGPSSAYNRRRVIVYLNGRYLPPEEAKISPEEPGFLFADAIYEVVRSGAGRPYRLAEHLGRMRDGLSALRIAAEPSFFPEVAGHLVELNDLVAPRDTSYSQ